MDQINNLFFILDCLFSNNEVKYFNIFYDFVFSLYFVMFLTLIEIFQAFGKGWWKDRKEGSLSIQSMSKYSLMEVIDFTLNVYLNF